MQMNIPQNKAVRIDFPVRLKIRDEDLKKMRGENMDPKLLHIDTVVQLGASDFESDDERLFAVDFAATLASERGAYDDGKSQLVPGKLKMEGIGYPVDVEEVARKVAEFLKSGVEAERERAEAIAHVGAALVAARQMAGPVIERFVSSKATLAARCNDWGDRRDRAIKALDAKAYQRLQDERKQLLQEIPGDMDAMSKELVRLLEKGLASVKPEIEWGVSSSQFFSMGDRDRARVERSENVGLSIKLSGKVGVELLREESPVMRFKAVVMSQMFRKWATREEVALDGVRSLDRAFKRVRKDDGEAVFDRAIKEQALKAEDLAREKWIEEYGSMELKAALEQKLPFMSLYARERFVAKCQAAGADLKDFLIEVDSNLFFTAMLRTHNDPSVEGLKLIGQVGSEVPGIGVGRLEQGMGMKRVKAANEEVLVVEGASVAPGCPTLYLWRKVSASRAKR